MAQPLTAPSPVSPTERIETLDVLRGFALFGIALVNHAPGSTPVYALLSDLDLWSSPLDKAAMWLIQAFAEGKFYPLFSFLFGLGFAILLTRAQERAAPFAWLYTRRLFVLLLIGLVHAFFIWYGDILVPYAILGGVLLAFFRKRGQRTLLVWAAILLLIPILLNAVLFGALAAGRSVPEAAAEIEQAFAESAVQYRAAAEEATRIYSSGSWGEITAQRARDVLFLYISMPFFAPNVLAMFLLGLYTWRRGVFQDQAAHLPFIRRVFTWGLLVGLIGGLAYATAMAEASRAVPTLEALIGAVAFGLGGPALALGYAAGLTLLIQRSASWRRRLAPVAAAGRMALTNYLLQSVLATFVLYSYGFGLYGQMGPAAGILLVLAIYAVNLALSVWWLDRFQFGPAEWLWRSLTYLRPQPMRPLQPPSRDRASETAA